ncbi:MAG: DNA-binding MarR family transcriptional regulator [Oceanicoccus sp.]|jgi:DNA-binding MarR family transcriptional regulator
MIEECLNFNLRKANRVVNKIYDGHLQHCGVKSGQFTMLRVIHLHKQTTNRDLQALMLIDQTTLSRGLKPLIRDGFIQVTQGEDLRVKLLALSPKGIALYKEAKKCWKKAQTDLIKRLGSDFPEELVSLTQKIAALNS